jgi:copper chaperone
MKTLTFKTNIKCGGCIATVTPFLNNVAGIEKWEVDTTNPNKVLTVTGEIITTESIETAIKQAGYNIEAN